MSKYSNAFKLKVVKYCLEETNRKANSYILISRGGFIWIQF